MRGVFGRNERRNITFPYREHTQIINTVDMVSVCVCKPDRINVLDPVRQELKAKLWRCINKQTSPIDL